MGASEASRAAVSLAATGGPARPAGAGGRLRGYGSMVPCGGRFR
ncbi:Uncharacterised protein [Bordetella pertussis]|nr:Uncharacterised protein [Bordetella pertussis]